MQDGPDYYQALGVQKGASEDEIRKAYRKLAHRYHPDKNQGDDAAEERFKEISAAYDVLSDGNKKKLYDEFGHVGLREGFDADKARAYRAWGGAPGGSGGGFRQGPDFDISDIFGDLFGGRGGGGAGGFGRMRGQDYRTIVDIDLAQALRGIEVQVRVSGEPLVVRIPKGADDGSLLRVQGRGGPGAGGGPPGDLVIETRVKEHPHYKREGLDLVLKLPVRLDEAYNGAAVKVPTIDGSVKLTVPPRTQQGTRLRLRGKGVERGNKRGDLYVDVTVMLPEADDPGLGELLDRTKAAYGDVRAELSL